MNKDLRARNVYFLTESMSSYFIGYSKAIAYALGTIDTHELNVAHDLLTKTRGRIFVGGNGGSAAIADHLNCDFTKGLHTEQTGKALNVHSLVGSMALFTALSNDVGYDKVFVQQLEMANVTSDDTVILISSSGNSPNIIDCAKMCVSSNIPLIGMTGFNGGVLNAISDVKLYVKFNNYGIIEDCHQILMHTLAQYIYVLRQNKTTSP